MSSAIVTLHLPDNAITTDKLAYYTLYHPISHLQNALTTQASKSIRNDILPHPSNYATMETLSPLLQRPDGNKHLDATSPLIHDPPDKECDTQWAGHCVAQCPPITPKIPPQTGIL
eukprot:14055126-Ditylum_brightwellii.AAC.2